MKNNTIGGRAAAALATLFLAACAHGPRPAGAEAPPASPQTAASNPPAAANPWSSLPPDVLATCRDISAASSAGKLADAAELARQCIASHSLPVQIRALVLQQLTLLEMALHHNSAALEAQLSAIELEPKPTDMQLAVLAKLYDANQRYDEGLATLERLRANHAGTDDLNGPLGMAYYNERGALLAATGRHEEAVASLTKGIALQPALAEPYRLRAREREALGDVAGARADYASFARWARDGSIDAPTRARLSQLKIDPAVERRHPFGSANPLRESAAQSLKAAQQALQAATTPQEKAKAYGEISAHLDGMNRSEQALAAIDKAIALAPDDIRLRQSKTTTLVALKRTADAIALADPLLAKMRADAAAAVDPSAVYRTYIEASGSSAYAHMIRGEWAPAIAALEDVARASPFYDQDYMASLYLYVRARSGGSAPRNAFFDDYIGRNTVPLPGNYRRSILLLMQGRATVDEVYLQAVLLPDSVAIQNALAETWFMAAAYAHFVKHDEAAARGYVTRLNDLQPYGTNEWTMVEQGAV